MHEGVPDKHESHGALQISRCQHSSTALFGSSILHDNIIRLRISAAEMERRNNTDYLYYSPYVRDLFVEQMDKTVMEAKGNIEGFIQNRMAVIANEAIAQNIGALNDGGGTAALLRPESGEKPSVLERIRAGVPQNNHNAPSGDKKARTDRE